jgi:hypothetical protein
VETFTAASHDEVLRSWFRSPFCSRAAGARGSPSASANPVVGEILAGVVLGPSCCRVWCRWSASGSSPRHPCRDTCSRSVALIGVMLLLIVTGLETDLALIRRRIRVSFGVSAGGLVCHLRDRVGARVLASPTTC